MVSKFITAYYLTETDLLEWIDNNSGYTRKQYISLGSYGVAGSAMKRRQRDEFIQSIEHSVDQIELRRAGAKVYVDRSRT